MGPTTYKNGAAIFAINSRDGTVSGVVVCRSKTLVIIVAYLSLSIPPELMSAGPSQWSQRRPFFLLKLPPKYGEMIWPNLGGESEPDDRRTQIGSYYRLVKNAFYSYRTQYEYLMR
jgi:hypothetical protein